MKHFDIAGKTLGIIIIFILAVACQPTVTVVTATPIAPTIAPSATLAPITPTIAPSATVAPPTGIVAPTLPSGATPTREIWGKHRTCAETNPFPFDPIDGCNITRNGLFDRGSDFSLLGVDQPRYWNAEIGTIPVTCGNGYCRFNLSANPIYQSRTVYSQMLTDIEKDTCYLIKITYDFRLMGTVKPFPENIIYGVFNDVLSPVVQGNSKPNSGDANFYTGGGEAFWVALGGNNPMPTVTLGIDRRFPVLQNGSWVEADGFLVYPVIPDYCRDTTITLGVSP